MSVPICTFRFNICYFTGWHSITRFPFFFRLSEKVKWTKTGRDGLSLHFLTLSWYTRRVQPIKNRLRSCSARSESDALQCQREMHFLLLLLLSSQLKRRPAARSRQARKKCEFHGQLILNFLPLGLISRKYARLSLSLFDSASLWAAVWRTWLLFFLCRVFTALIYISVSHYLALSLLFCLWLFITNKPIHRDPWNPPPLPFSPPPRPQM